jgi:predicted Fe-S protein YdhL (DUF1289 family)
LSRRLCVRQQDSFCAGCLHTHNEAREREKMIDFRSHQIINDRTRREQKVERYSLNAAAKKDL